MNLFQRREEKKLHPELWNEVDHFIDKEEHLLRSEFHEKMLQFKTAAFAFAGGLSLVTVGLMCLSVGCIAFLATQMTLWQASFLVAFVFLAIGGVLFGTAKTKYQESKTKPTKSIESLQEFKNSFFDRFH